MEFLETYILINRAATVQFAIRLPIIPGSIPAEPPAMKPHLESIDQISFSYEWTRPDSRMYQRHETASWLIERDS